MATRKPSTKSGKKAKVHKVMDEYKHGDLKSGQGGKGGKVKSRKQAIAIAMSESGQSKPGKKKAAKKKTAKKSASKKTARKKTAKKSSAKKSSSRKTAAKKSSSRKSASKKSRGKTAKSRGKAAETRGKAVKSRGKAAGAGAGAGITASARRSENQDSAARLRQQDMSRPDAFDSDTNALSGLPYLMAPWLAWVMPRSLSTPV